jgi:hypothetical protein
MLSFLWSLFGNLKTLLFSVGGAIAGLYFLFLKKKTEVQEKVIKEQEYSIKVHEGKENINKQDDVIDKETKDKISEVRDNVESGKTDVEKAEILSDTLDNYFNDH